MAAPRSVAPRADSQWLSSFLDAQAAELGAARRLEVLTADLAAIDDKTAVARTPFMVARIMATGETVLFASGEYRDRFVQVAGKLMLAERVAVCDSTVTDTLLALPL